MHSRSLFALMSLLCGLHCVSAERSPRGLALLGDNSLLVVENDGGVKRICGEDKVVGYALLGSKVYLDISDVTGEGYLIRPPKTKLQTCIFSPLADSCFTSCKVLPIAETGPMWISPTGDYLIVRSSGNIGETRNFLLSRKTDTVSEVKQLHGFSVLNWCSNNELLCVPDSQEGRPGYDSAVLYDVERSDFRRLGLNVPLPNSSIESAERWDSSSVLVKTGGALAVVENGETRILDSSNVYWYKACDEKNVVIIRYESPQSWRMEMVRMNRDGGIDMRIDLNAILHNAKLRVGIEAISNYLDGTIVVLCWNADSGESSFYQIDLLNLAAPPRVLPLRSPLRVRRLSNLTQF